MKKKSIFGRGRPAKKSGKWGIGWKVKKITRGKNKGANALWF